MIVAQATGVPPTGASNAEDFQPQTRNPQADALPTQPQNSNLQNPSSGEVLGEQNVRIFVPNAGVVDANSSSRQVASTNTNGSDAWMFIVIGLAILIIATLALKSRQKPSEQKPVQAVSEEVVIKPVPKKSKTGKKKNRKRKKK